MGLVHLGRPTHRGEAAQRRAQGLRSFPRIRRLVPVPALADAPEVLALAAPEPDRGEEFAVAMPILSSQVRDDVLNGSIVQAALLEERIAATAAQQEDAEEKRATQELASFSATARHERLEEWSLSDAGDAEASLMDMRLGPGSIETLVVKCEEKGIAGSIKVMPRRGAQHCGTCQGLGEEAPWLQAGVVYTARQGANT